MAGAADRALRAANGSLRSRRARAALELERIRDAVAHGLFEVPPASGGAVQVVVLRSDQEFALFARPGAQGLYTRSLWDEPTIVLPADLGTFQRAVVAHEMAHLLAAADLQRQPPWFREGIACYAERVRFDGRGKNVRVGDAPPHRAAEALASFGMLWPWSPQSEGAQSLHRLLVERDQLRGEDYGVAWALVDFLLNERPGKFGELEDRFAAGEDPQDAWRAIFPQWDPGAAGGTELLEKEMAAYFGRKGTALLVRHQRLPSIPPPAERVLASAEVHELRLALGWPNVGRPVAREERLDEAREALAESAGTPTAILLLVDAMSPEARSRAEEATRVRPGDARTWVLLAASLPEADVAGKEAALRRAIATDPGSQIALVALARHLLQAKRPSEALPHAKRAVELAPWSIPALVTAAETLEALGNCRNALVLVERVVTLASDDAERRSFVEIRDRLARACGRVPSP